MKYFCLCMSPAIDALVRLDRAPEGVGEIFKDVADEENVGGKGVNVARWLALRGADVVCGGLIGEDNAALFERELARYGIGDRFLRVPGSTRRNEMIAWPGGAFKVNRAAFPGLNCGDDLLGLVLERLGGGEGFAGSVVVISGSLPGACGAGFYAEAVRELKSRGAFVVLDASGEALRLGVAAHPDVVKPNADECKALVGFVPASPDEFGRATEMLRKDVPHPIISDGAGGCWFDGEFAPAPKVDVVDTTAAGDTLLAEWCFSRDPRKAVAAGSAACGMPGSKPPDPDKLFDRET